MQDIDIDILCMYTGMWVYIGVPVNRYVSNTLISLLLLLLLLIVISCRIDFS